MTLLSSSRVTYISVGELVTIRISNGHDDPIKVVKQILIIDIDDKPLDCVQCCRQGNPFTSMQQRLYVDHWFIQLLEGNNKLQNFPRDCGSGGEKQEYFRCRQCITGYFYVYWERTTSRSTFISFSAKNNNESS